MDGGRKEVVRGYIIGVNAFANNLLCRELEDAIDDVAMPFRRIVEQRN